MNRGVVIPSFLMPFAGTSLIAQQFGSQQSFPTRDPDQQPNDLVPRPFFYPGAGPVGGGQAPLAVQEGATHRLPTLPGFRRGLVRQRAQDERRRPAQSEGARSRPGWCSLLQVFFFLACLSGKRDLDVSPFAKRLRRFGFRVEVRDFWSGDSQSTVAKDEAA